jgi:predicted phage terminase large subunit-like protein
VTLAPVSPWEAAARLFEPPPVKPRRWATPSDMACELEPRTVRTAMQDCIDGHLVRVADGHLKRLMIFCPPQEGKSQKVSRRFPAWLLSHDPTLRIGIVSFEQERATRWGREIKRDVEMHPALGIQLRADSKAAGRWHTEQGGGVYCAGIGAALTGEALDVLIIDDPVKGRKEAESDVYREAAWDWWESVGSTRLSTRGVVVLMMTRWHEDDLAGRLLANEPDDWVVLRIPAIAEDNDPLGRQPGEELQSVQKRPPGHFRKLEQVRSPYVWLSVYQQAPSAAEGLIFKRIWWRYWTPSPGYGLGNVDLAGRTYSLNDAWRFATVDLAASTRTSADYTVISAWAKLISGDLILLDRVRARIGEEDHFANARPLVERWKLDTVFIERGQIGMTLVRQATQDGIPVSPLDAETDKLSRALPASAWCKAGRIWLPAGAWWLPVWTGEHASFPTAAHDDQVDTTSYAVRVAVTKWTPPPQRAPEQEHRAGQEIDLMRVPL